MSDETLALITFLAIHTQGKNIMDITQAIEQTTAAKQEYEAVCRAIAQAIASRLLEMALYCTKRLEVDGWMIEVESGSTRRFKVACLDDSWEAYSSATCTTELVDMFIRDDVLPSFIVSLVQALEPVCIVELKRMIEDYTSDKEECMRALSKLEKREIEPAEIEARF